MNFGSLLAVGELVEPLNPYSLEFLYLYENKISHFVENDNI